MSKRASKSVETKLLGAVGLSAMFVLTGCGEEEITTHAYQSVDQCVAADIYDDNFCVAQFNAAKEAHVKLAPRYETIEDCEKDFGEGQCSRPEVAGNTNNGGGGFFFPYMMGYMMGNNAGATQSYSSPIYSTRSEGLRSLSGRSVSQDAFSRNGAKAGTSNFAKPSSRPTFSRGVSVSSRGGFGATGRGFSMGG